MRKNQKFSAEEAQLLPRPLSHAVGTPVAYLRGARCDAPLWPDHKKNVLQATLYKKVRFLPFSSKNCKNSTMFDGLLSYRYNMRLK